ncbi:hypothetical protein ACSBR2_008576 [Camellia fascicularis]
MADAYWRYGESRQQSNLPPLIGKRPRSDYDVPSGHELPGYFTRDDERAAHRVMRDTDSIGASYDRYLRSAQISSYGGGDSARPLSGGLSGRPSDDPRIIGIGGSDPAVIAKNRSLGLGDGRPELPLPPDATNTLFVEGLPANCTRREVSRILYNVLAFLLLLLYICSLWFCSLNLGCRYLSPFCRLQRSEISD